MTCTFSSSIVPTIHKTRGLGIWPFPAAGMNPNERPELMETLREIRDLGYTLLVVEHNMRVVLGISDRLIVLDRGRKIADGDPEEVFKDPVVTTAYLGDDYDVS